MSGEDEINIPGHSDHLASCVDGNISEAEKKFLHLVGVGDRDGIMNLLQNEEDLNVDCCDYMGERALEIAIRNRNTGFVEFLLDEIKVDCVHFYCGILRAVLENKLEILMVLLNRCENDEKMNATLRNFICGGEICLVFLQEAAASDLTPLMAAAIRGNMEITRVFLSRGYSIEKPHQPKCQCTELCAKRAIEGETLTKSIHRINTYRAISSPTYILLTSDDPILTAFELNVELKNLASELPENCSEYQKLADQCSTFATDLLDQCRTTEEIKIILQQRKGFPDLGQHRFRRLKLAIRHEQKKFVSHPSCQQVLRSLLMEGLPAWNSWGSREKLLYCIQHTFLAIPVCTAYIFVPRANLISSLKVPFNRFIYFTTSYAILLSFLLITLLSDRFNKNGADKAYGSAVLTEVAVSFWMIGFALDLFFQYRCVAINKNLWSWLKTNAFDIIMVLLFMISQFITVLMILRVVESPKRHIGESWRSPATTGYALYATASVLAFSRLLHWCHISYDLGPLIVSLKYMIGDIFRFFVILYIIIFSFAIGLNSIYKDFRDEGSTSDAFTTLACTLKNLFWAIFGKGEPGYADIGSLHYNNNTQHWPFVEMTGYSLWGAYHFVTTLVLLNMVIGMMAESYQRVLKNADIEWKFGCTTFWQRFLDSSCLVPPPFNLVPSLPCGVYYYRFIRKMIKGTLEEKDINFSGGFLNGNFHEMSVVEEKPNDEEDYKKLLVILIRRYLHSENHSMMVVGPHFTSRHLYAENSNV